MASEIVTLSKSTELRLNEINKIKESKQKMLELERVALERAESKNSDENQNETNNEWSDKQILDYWKAKLINDKK